MRDEVHPAEHGPEIERLLAGADLPPTEPGDIRRIQFFVYDTGASPAGVIGVESCGSDALLRSLAVAAEKRGSGIGRQLVDHAEAWAAARGICRLYLLTTTADGFFASLSYETVSRETAPGPIRRTRQFDVLCPASAVLQLKDLRRSSSSIHRDRNGMA